jgi:Sulfotransferase family
MMILRDKHLAFVHIPKTGGSSLTRVLGPSVDAGDRCASPRSEGQAWQGDWHAGGTQHATLHEGLIQMGERGLDPGSFRFATVVRSPFAWTYSIWENFYHRHSPEGVLGRTRNFLGRHSRRMRNAEEVDDRFRSSSSTRAFPDFLRFLDDNWEASWLDEFGYGAWGFCDQYSWIANDAGVEVDLIGKFEALPEFWSELRSALELQTDQVLPHLLKRPSGSHASFATAFDADLVDIVTRLYARDFEMFGYSHDPKDSVPFE